MSVLLAGRVEESKKGRRRVPARRAKSSHHSLGSVDSLVNKPFTPR